MATHDGKTFGKFEVEQLYDYMAEHKSTTFKQLVNWCMTVQDMTNDEAINAVVAMRMERRKMIMTQSNIAGVMSMQRWAQSLVDNSGDWIMRQDMITQFASQWGVDDDAASNFIDNAIVNTPNPEKRFVVYENLDHLARFRMKQAAEDGDTEQALRWAKLTKLSEEEKLAQAQSNARSFVKSSRVPFGKRTDAAAGDFEAIDTIAPSVERSGEMIAEYVERRVTDGGAYVDRLGRNEHLVLNIYREGMLSRDSGEPSPYRGNTLAHCLHAAGWVSRDLQIALSKKDKNYSLAPLTTKMRDIIEFVDVISALATQKREHVMDALTQPSHIKGEASWHVGSQVSKVKGYRFPSEVVAEFKTRKGKLRYVVEGIGDGNDECLHIFSEADLEDIKADDGWTFFIDGGWRWSEVFPRHDGAVDIRPATPAERSFAFRPS